MYLRYLRRRGLVEAVYAIHTRNHIVMNLYLIRGLHLCVSRYFRYNPEYPSIVTLNSSVKMITDSVHINGVRWYTKTPCEFVSMGPSRQSIRVGSIIGFAVVKFHTNDEDRETVFVCLRAFDEVGVVRKVSAPDVGDHMYMYRVKKEARRPGECVAVHVSMLYSLLCTVPDNMHSDKYVNLSLVDRLFVD